MKQYLFLAFMLVMAEAGMLSDGVAFGGEITIKTDEFTIVGFNYGKAGVPGPCQGVWKHTYFEPNPSSSIKEICYKWKPDSDAKSPIVHFEWILRGADDSSVTTTFKIDVNNWTHGWCDAEERKEMTTNKTLLHYDRVPVSKYSGVIPSSLSIDKYVIGNRDGEDVELVAYRAKTLEILKRCFPMTEYESWGWAKNGMNQS